MIVKRRLRKNPLFYVKSLSKFSNLYVVLRKITSFCVILRKKLNHGNFDFNNISQFL